MKSSDFKKLPTLISISVLAMVCLAQSFPVILPKFDLIERIELMTYDWRVRQAFDHPGPISTNLGAVFIDDDALASINQATDFHWPWPRFIYGLAFKEMAQQGAAAIASDVFFIERHPNYTETRVEVTGVGALSSDEYLTRELKAAGNVILGTAGETTNNVWHILLPAEIFRTNAVAVAHATSDPDRDGVLRRARPFKDDTVFGRYWHMGIQLAARGLGLDLKNAVVQKDRIILRGPNVERVIPLDREGNMYIDWSIAWNDKRLYKESIEYFIAHAQERARGKPIEGRALDGKLLTVGSIGSGNNISDVGPSPLERQSYLVSKHWNIANSVLTGRFIRRSPAAVEISLILALLVVSAVLTLGLRPPWPSVCVLAVALVYVAVAWHLYVAYRYWLPITLPVLGGLFLNHVALVSYQVIFEQREKRKVKGVFSKLVSPNVVNELLNSEKLDLGGSRREITVFFADVRGFTQMTDQAQEDSEKYVKDHNLTGEVAEAYHDATARETLATVNIYLATIADQIKKHNGTLDKYIGDCVMAFWGAPTPNPHHAESCVLAAIDAQRAMHQLNLTRAEENKRREAENKERAVRGEPPLRPLPLLSLGTGINSGIAIVGLMGSDAHIVNFTVFGREVNLASRLEGVSGRGRIIIGESTFNSLKKDDPVLAATADELAPVTVKGIKQAVRIFEIPWKQDQPAQTVATPQAPPPTQPAAEGKHA